MAFQSGSDIEYTMTFQHENLSRYYSGLYLVDKVENKTIDITSSGSTYTFIAESTPNPVNRFQLVTRYYEKKAADENSNLKVFSSNGMIFVHNFSSHIGNALIYDISGRFIKQVSFGANGVTAIGTGIKAGSYVTQCCTETERVTKRVIVH